MALNKFIIKKSVFLLNTPFEESFFRGGVYIKNGFWGGRLLEGAFTREWAFIRGFTVLWGGCNLTIETDRNVPPERVLFYYSIPVEKGLISGTHQQSSLKIVKILVNKMTKSIKNIIKVLFKCHIFNEVVTLLGKLHTRTLHVLQRAVKRV